MSFVQSTTGTVHLLSALTAMVLGATVLLLKKGSLSHKRVGYAYVWAMIVVNGTAFLLYHLFGKFGPFHALALLSGTTILAGMVPVLLRSRVKGWRYYHYYFMNWSVVGLYAAFWAETLVRLFPMQRFWPVVMLATGLTTGFGSYLIRRYRSRFLDSPGVAVKAF